MSAASPGNGSAFIRCGGFLYYLCADPSCNYCGEDWIEFDAYGKSVDGIVPVNNSMNPSQAHVCVTVRSKLASVPATFSVYKMIPNVNLGSCGSEFHSQMHFCQG